jgi:hypothetical protein
MIQGRLAEAYTEIAALTSEELNEISADPALTAAYRVHCDFWRGVQTTFDRYAAGDDPWPVTKRLLAMKLPRRAKTASTP